MIEQVTSGSLAKNGKLNEVIRAVNSLMNSDVQIALIDDLDDAESTASMVSGEAGTVITLPIVDPPPIVENPHVGDMLYYDGAAWVVLEPINLTDSDPVLRHDGNQPYWDEPVGEDCT
jgi:hypothetical protein